MTDFISPDPHGIGGNKNGIDDGTTVIARSMRPGPMNANFFERSSGAHFDAFRGTTYQERANAIAAEVTQRGSFKNKGEADWIYQNNSNRNLVVTINASSLSVKTTGKWINDPQGGLRAPGRVLGDDYWVHGQITVRARPDGTYGIYNQLYHYDMHANFTPTELVRNIATFIGQPPAGMPNTPYIIKYEGNTNITNLLDITRPMR